jgi:hypothetical protein
VNATFKKAGVQVWFDTGRYRQPPKHRGLLCEWHSEIVSRFVEIYQSHVDASVWHFRSAKTQWNDGSKVESHFRPLRRSGYTQQEAKELAARFCETGSFSEGDNQ